MKFNKTALAAGISAVIGLGVASQSHASIYAGARALIQNLTVVVLDAGVPDPAAATNFNFNIQGTATLTPGGGDIQAANCQGAPGAPPGANNCQNGAGPAPVLALSSPAEVINTGPATYGTNFSFVGPTLTDEFARADAIIDDAQVVGDISTAARNIAEAELQTGTNGSATSNIDSTTDFNFVFTVAGPGTLVIDFEADPDLNAQIQDPPPGGVAAASASASITLGATFTENATGNSVDWTPTTPTGGADPTCTNLDVSNAGGTFACNTETVTENLNASVVTGLPSPSQNDFSLNNNFFGAYQLSINYANAGTYSLLLTETKAVTVTRTAAVPEPVTLMLMGVGLAGLGVTRRLQKKSTV